MVDKKDVSAWARIVGKWVGDDPLKAVTFGIACAVAGILWSKIGFWPVFNFWPF